MSFGLGEEGGEGGGVGGGSDDESVVVLSAWHDQDLSQWRILRAIVELLCHPSRHERVLIPRNIKQRELDLRNLINRFPLQFRHLFF